MKIITMAHPDDNTNLHYMCSVCGARYLDESSCRAHMEDHYEENLNDTDLLKKREKAARLAKHHRRFKKTAGKSIGASLFRKLTAVKSNVKCDECGKIYISETRLRQHQKIHTDAKPYECNVCLRKFRTISYLRNHMHTHLTEKTQQCPHCDKTYKTFNDLRYHKRVKHGYMKSQKCPICANKFVIEAVFIKHLKNHLSEITYECKICRKIFSSNYYLSIHKKSHSGDKITADLSGSPCHIHTHGCSLCNKRFSSEENLKVHSIMHNEDKPYKCVCGKSFKEGHKYRSHAVSSCNVDVSLIQPKFHCSVCPKSFYSAYHQSKHEETHLKKRELVVSCQVCEQYSPNTYVCMHCQQEFDSKNYFSIHLLLHKLGAGNPMDPTVETFAKTVNPFTGKEVYQCHFCKEEFNELEHAMLHERSHNINLTCKYCSITYATKKNLMKHLRTVHGMTDDKENEGSVVKRSDNLNRNQSESGDNTPCSSPTRNDENNSPKTDSLTMENDMSGRNEMLHKSASISEENPDFFIPIPLSTKIKRTAICDICKVRFASKLTLLNHIREEHFEHPIAKDLLVNGIECNLCHKHYPTRYDLVKHKNKKHKWDNDLGNSEDFFCEACRKVYMTRHSLSVHIFRKHEGGEFTQNRPHACTMCEKAFVTKSGLRKHLRFTHDLGFGEPCPGTERESAEAKIKECPVCCKVYNNMADLKQHILKKHPDDYSVLLLLQENADFECSSCRVVFTSRSDFIEHVKEEHTDLKLTSLISNELVHCDECDKVFYDKKHYERHAKSHQSEVVMCNICYSTHKRPNTLKLHMKKYHPDICGKETTEKRVEEDGEVDLEGNIKIKEEPNLDNHFVCEVCGLFFTSKIVLKRHLNQKHVKDCKHICSYCARGFASKEACNKHEKRHKQLDNPSSEDTVKPVLSKEQKEALKNEPIECTICWKTFIGKKRFRIHLQKTHPVSNLVRCECCDVMVENLEDHTCVSKSDDGSNDSFDDHFIVDEAMIQTLSTEEEDVKPTVIPGTDKTDEYLCEKCEDIFPSEEEYWTHIKQDCTKKQTTNETDIDSNQADSNLRVDIKKDENTSLQSDTIDITSITDLKSDSPGTTNAEEPSPIKQDSPIHKKSKEEFLKQTNLSPSTPKSSSDSEVLDRRSRHSRAKKDFSLYHTPIKQISRPLKIIPEVNDKAESTPKKSIKKTKNLVQSKQNETLSSKSTVSQDSTNPYNITTSNIHTEDKNMSGEQTSLELHVSNLLSTDDSTTASPTETLLTDVDKSETSTKLSSIISSASKLTPSGDCTTTAMKKIPIVLLDRIKTPTQQSNLISNRSSSTLNTKSVTEGKTEIAAKSGNESASVQNNRQTRTQSQSKPNNEKQMGLRKGSIAETETKNGGNMKKHATKAPSTTVVLNLGKKSKSKKSEVEISNGTIDLTEGDSEDDFSENNAQNKVALKPSRISSVAPKTMSSSDELSKIKKRNSSKAEIENGSPSESKRSRKSDIPPSVPEAESALHCKVCNKGFLSNRLYLRHMTIHDKKKPKSKSVSEYQKVYMIP